MLALDIPSFFIGACVAALTVLLYIIFTSKPPKSFPVQRTAGSRAEDKDVVERREKREADCQIGKRIFRKGEYYNTPEESPLKKRYGGGE
jgi:hypothetical protein